jgi:hypothetical protein
VYVVQLCVATVAQGTCAQRQSSVRVHAHNERGSVNECIWRKQLHSKPVDARAQQDQAAPGLEHRLTSRPQQDHAAAGRHRLMI